MSKITEVRVKYADGSEQIADIAPESIACEMFKGGGLHSAGDMTPEDYRSELVQDLIESCKQPDKAEVGLQVVEALNLMGILAYYEYPGYVSVPLIGEAHNGKTLASMDGWSFDFGNINETWYGSVMHGETGEDYGKAAGYFDSKLARDYSNAYEIAKAVKGFLSGLHCNTEFRPQHAPRLTGVLDVLSRGVSIVENSEQADEHGEWLTEARELVRMLKTEVQS